MKTLNEAVEYIYNYIKDYDSKDGETFDKDALYEVMEEELLDAVEWVLTQDDMKNWVESKDDTYLDKVLWEKMWENYEALLQEMANDILNEYVLSEWEE